MSKRPWEKGCYPVIPLSRGQDCLLTEVRAARTAGTAKMLTELKGRDSKISFLWMRASGEGSFCTVITLKTSEEASKVAEKQVSGEWP